MFNVYMDDIRHGPDMDACKHLPDWMDWVIVRSVDNTRRLLELGLVNKLSLDHDMGSKKTGYDLIKWMAETGYWPKGEIWIHSANPVGRDNMVATINRYHPDGLVAIVGDPVSQALLNEEHR